MCWSYCHTGLNHIFYTTPKVVNSNLTTWRTLKNNVKLKLVLSGCTCHMVQWHWDMKHICKPCDVAVKSSQCRSQQRLNSVSELMSDVVITHQIATGILWCHSRVELWPFKYKMSLYLLTCKILLLLTLSRFKKGGLRWVPNTKEVLLLPPSFYHYPRWLPTVYQLVQLHRCHHVLPHYVPEKRKQLGHRCHRGYFHLTVTCPCVIQSAKHNFEYLSFGLRVSLDTSDWILLYHSV